MNIKNDSNQLLITSAILCLTFIMLDDEAGNPFQLLANPFLDNFYIFNYIFLFKAAPDL